MILWLKVTILWQSNPNITNVQHLPSEVICVLKQILVPSSSSSSSTPRITQQQHVFLSAHNLSTSLHGHAVIDLVFHYMHLGVF